MRRITVLTIGIIMLGLIMVTTATAVDSKKEVSVEAAEQVILDLLYQPTAAAVAEYYGEPTQFWHPEILSIQKVSDSRGHEVVIQVETFHGPHNPPYGLETMTFYVGPTGQPQLAHYDHRDEQ
ncbi:MAG: DUF3888 domain-containing protein [Lachnospiraceae bacterium]|nr:DUF3888 domain-containing protein [Lachnospiraceae bacterium]